MQVHIQNRGSIDGDAPNWKARPIFLNIPVTLETAEFWLAETEKDLPQDLLEPGHTQVAPSNDPITLHGAMPVDPLEYRAVAEGKRRAMIVVVLRYWDEALPKDKLRITEFVAAPNSGWNGYSVLIDRQRVVDPLLKEHEGTLHKSLAFKGNHGPRPQDIHHKPRIL